MRLLQSIRPSTLFLVTVLTTFALAINDDPGSAGRPKPFSPSHGQAPGSAPSSVTVPLSPCVNNCLAEVAMKGSCSSFTDKLCFCANLILATDLQRCVLATCPSQETQAMTVYAETCGLPGSSPLSTLLSSFGLEPTAPGSALPTAPLPASSIKGTPGTQPAAPTSPGAPAPAPTASEPAADPHATTVAAPKASTPTPAAAAGNGPGGASSANSAAPSGHATDSAGDEVTVTVTTDSPDGTALNPHVNGAGRRGCFDGFGAKAGLAVVGGVGIVGWVF